MKNEAKEKRLKLGVGDIIPACVDGEKIASWHDMYINRFYCKVNYKDGKWEAITNPVYRRAGLVVFINRHTEEGEQIRITKVSRSYAVGEVTCPQEEKKMLIYYYLSEKGRKLEFSAGRPAQEERSIDVDVSDIIDLENIHVDEFGSPEYYSFEIVYETSRREVKAVKWGDRHMGKYDRVLTEEEAKKFFVSWRERVQDRSISLAWNDAIEEDRKRSKLAAEEAAKVERLLELYRQGKVYEKDMKGHWKIFK